MTSRIQQNFVRKIIQSISNNTLTLLGDVESIDKHFAVSFILSIICLHFLLNRHSLSFTVAVE
jgi:hypothetical protein